MKSRWLATLLVFTACGGWLALASPPSPTPTPGLQMKPPSAVLGLVNPVKFNCPTVTYALHPTLGGSEAASWNATGLASPGPGFYANQVARIANPGKGYDVLYCGYSAHNGQGTKSPAFAALSFPATRFAPTTHPICKAILWSKSFECRRLKPGESYSATTQY